MTEPHTAANLTQLGFEDTNTHLARTYMLDELQALLAYVADEEASLADYRAAIVDDNCLGKRSGRTRKLTAKHLTALYALDPAVPLFQALRYLWDRDPEGRPLLALICATARDPLLRESAALILDYALGAPVPRSDMEAFLAVTYPDRFKPTTLKSTAQNLLGTWTKAGHLQGKTNKTRSHPIATPGAVAYAVYVSYLTGARGQFLFSSPYAALLDLDRPQALDLAALAAQRGWMVLKHSGDVVEVRFPALFTPPPLESRHDE